MGDIGSDGPATVRPKTVHTFDELIRERALDEDQTPLIAFPKTKLGIDDYEVFSGRELNRLVDGAAKALIKAGIEPVVSLSKLQLSWQFLMADLVRRYSGGDLWYFRLRFHYHRLWTWKTRLHDFHHLTSFASECDSQSRLPFEHNNFPPRLTIF